MPDGSEAPWGRLWTGLAGPRDGRLAGLRGGPVMRRRPAGRPVHASDSLADDATEEETGMAELAVMAMGPDRPGIVAAVAQVLHEADGNVLDSAMTVLGGRFTLALLVETGTRPQELRDQLASATAGLDLQVTVDRAGDAADHGRPTHLLSVYGADHPGILAGVAQVLADLGANVTDLSTRLVGAADEPVYAMVVELATDDEGALRTALAGVADDLAVDWTLRPVDDVTY